MPLFFISQQVHDGDLVLDPQYIPSNPGSHVFNCLNCYSYEAQNYVTWE